MGMSCEGPAGALVLPDGRGSEPPRMSGFRPAVKQWVMEKAHDEGLKDILSFHL